MPAWLEGRPFLITFAVLFGIVLLRAQATYWAGRGVITGALHTRLAEWLRGPRLTRAIDAMNKWGLPVVTLSFLTIGFQTAVNAAAGLTRMRWGRYTLAMVPGCLAWAAVYATVGLAAIAGWLHLTDGWRWVVLGAAVLVIAAVVTVVRLRHRARAATGRKPAPDPVGTA